jgi:hypothetical protein
MEAHSRRRRIVNHSALVGVVAVGMALALWPPFGFVAILTQHSLGSFLNAHWHALSPPTLALSVVLLGGGAMAAFVRQAWIVSAVAMVGMALSTLWRALVLDGNAHALQVVEFLVSLTALNAVYVWQLRRIQALTRRSGETAVRVLLGAQAVLNVVLLIVAITEIMAATLAAGVIAALCVMPLPSIILKQTTAAKTNNPTATATGPAV